MTPFQHPRVTEQRWPRCARCGMLAIPGARCLQERCPFAREGDPPQIIRPGRAE